MRKRESRIRRPWRRAETCVRDGHSSSRPHRRPAFWGLSPLAAALWLLLTAAIAPAARPVVDAKSAVLVDAATGVMLYGKAPHQRRPVASTTKIMTALIALESSSPDDWVTVSKNATRVEPSILDLKPGERVRMNDLLTALLLKSANDAAVAIAEHVSGSVKTFADKMNARARELGARDTHFVNPHGLNEPGHYSSAYDLALITREALKYPLFRELVGKKAAEVFRPDTVGEEVVSNHNKLLWRSDYVDGVKTGYVAAAGPCIVASATKNGWQLVAVVLDSPQRYDDALALLNWGFTTFQRKTYAEQGEAVDRVRVRRGRKAVVGAVCKNTLAAVVGPGIEDDYRLDLREKSLEAPVKKGAVVGEARLMSGEKVLLSSPLIAAEAVPLSRVVVAWWWGWRMALGLAAMAVMVRTSAKIIKANRRRRRRLPPQV